MDKKGLWYNQFHTTLLLNFPSAVMRTTVITLSCDSKSGMFTLAQN